MRWVVDLLLVCAAILKSIELGTEPASKLAIPFGRWLLPMLIAVGLGVGLLTLTRLDCGMRELA